MTRQVKERKTKEAAVALAKEIKAQLKRGELGRVHRVTSEEQQLCRQLRDPKRVFEEASERQDNFKQVTVAECCKRNIAE